MFNKPKNWIAGGLWRPKNLHSLEHLKFLYNVLCKNQLVTENNKSLLVETLRSISEILIWGDQNDSSVFDFFLEKNMLSFFLRFMRQKSGRCICVQLLQTLNILFDNISNETSVYYLLSNNHINSIIVHKFDFSDEEVMAYYISFLKTLSLKLNKHTIHFFYNEHTNDFALYTEAIKFFNHPESMVRIAVRTITLNVYKACRYTINTDGKGGRVKVDDKSMLRYIRDKTAAPYFSNLVWFIGNHIIELDSCVRNDADHHSRDRLADLVAEHLDHLHYLNDILCLHIDALNEVLTDHLLNRLLVPLYVYSLTKRRKYSARTGERPHVSSVVSLFLLSQVFLILSHAPLVRQLADIIFNGDISVCMVEKDQEGSPQAGGARTERKFVKPTEPLAQLLDNNRGKGGRPMKRPNYRNTDEPDASTSTAQTETSGDDVLSSPSTEGAASPGSAADLSSPNQNSTDEEKLAISGTLEQRQAEFSLANRPYLEAVFNALQCSENDYEALFALCLLYAMGHNDGINQELLDSVLMPTDKSTSKDHYNILLVEKLIMVIGLSCKNGSKVRLATLEMSILLLKQLVYSSETCFLSDLHLACLEGAREESTLLLRNFYKVWEKSEEIFLDMFEDEFREMKTRPLNVEYLTMDASILLPPTGTPLTGIDFNKRLPCGEVERARRAIRVFFLLRDLSLTLRQETETQLPLTKQDETVRVSEVLDLNNSDLIACTVITKDHRRERRFLVIDVLQLILVEPDTRRLGWGVVKFVGFLQDVEVSGDKDDSRSLHITIHKPSMNVHARPLPLLSARFIFDDHIRCMAAKQRLTKGRLKARQRKMQMIARLLELPTHLVDSMYQPSTSGFSAASNAMKNSSPGAAMAVRSHQVPGRALPDQTGRTRSDVVQRSVFASIEKTSGFGNAREREVHSKIPTPGGAARRVSQPIPIKPQPNGAPAGQPVQAVPHEGSPEIEEAEEAQPSPQAHAFQSLNLSSQQQEQRTRHHSGRSALENLPHLQEIPLEDLSKKAKAALSSATDFLTARRSLSAETRGRSSSYSPRRGRSSSTGSSSPLGRGSPHSGSPTSRARSDSRTGRQRAGSYPLAKQTKSVPAVSKQSTSFMINKQGSDHSGYAYEDPNAKRIEQQSVSGNRSRSNSGAGPKTLTPAQEPALSLVPSSGNNATLSNSAPKLLPPAEPEVLRKRSDTSSGDSESGASDSGSVTSASTEDSKDAVFKSKPQFTYDMPAPPTVDVNQAVAGRDGVELSTAADDSATDQLTKLAQMVQEHYSTLEEGANTIKLTTTAEIDDCRNQSS